MVVYGLGVLPLLKDLQEVFPDTHRPCYADCETSGRRFTRIHKFWDRLTAQGPVRGYFPDPTKSIFVTGTPNLRQAREYFSDLDSKAANKNATLTAGWGSQRGSAHGSKRRRTLG